MALLLPERKKTNVIDKWLHRCNDESIDTRIHTDTEIFVYREGDIVKQPMKKRLLCAQKCTRGGVRWVGHEGVGWGGVGHEGVGWGWVMKGWGGVGGS